MELVIKAAGLI